MRRAEINMAVALALLSIYLMWKSAEQQVGWIPGRGPGPGAFPFWLSVGMLLSSGAIIARWIFKLSPFSQAEGVYVTDAVRRKILVQVVILTLTLATIQFLGMYVAFPLFLIFMISVIGKHPWYVGASLALITPFVLFFFFEISLHIPLPKGVTEPLFYPIYAYWYG